MPDKNKINLWLYLLVIICLPIVITVSSVLGENQDVNTAQTASPNSQPEPNSVKDSSLDLYTQAVSFVERDEFDKAWPLLEQMLDEPNAPSVYRKALIALQQLSYGQYCLAAIKSPSEDNLPIVKNIRTKVIKIRELLNYIAIDDERLAAFAGAKERLLSQTSELINQCDTRETIISEIDSAKIAFEQNDYVPELAHLKKAAELDADVDKQLAQCELFVNALEQFDQKQYEQAEKSFSKIEKNDRHYSAVGEWLKKTKTEIFARDSISKLDSAWTQTNWSAMKNLTKEIEENSLFEKPSHLADRLNTANLILQERDLYLSAKDFISAAGHLKKITELLEENHDGAYSNTQKWAAKELAALTPKIESDIETLKQKSKTAWANYTQNRITDAEIEALTAVSDYNPTMSKVRYLKIAYETLSEANDLAGVINKQNSTCSLLFELESEILNYCKMLFNRAYVLEKNYGDVATAQKIYEVVIIMPVISSNTYPQQAQKRLESLRK
jgi:hypothetical protein